MEAGESYLQGTDSKLSRAHTRDSPPSSVGLMSGSIVIFKLLGEAEWG